VPNPAFVGKAWKRTASLAGCAVSSLDSNATHVNAVVMGMGSRRSSTGHGERAYRKRKKSLLTGAEVVQLERKGQ